MDFEESVSTIEALSGELVEVCVRGSGRGATEVARLVGELSRMEEVELSGAVAETLEKAVVERAATFVVGDATFSLLPSRFVSCDSMEHRSEWIEVRTQDATIWIGPKRPAWYD